MLCKLLEDPKANTGGCANKQSDMGPLHAREAVVGTDHSLKINHIHECQSQKHEVLQLLKKGVVGWLDVVVAIVMIKLSKSQRVRVLLGDLGIPLNHSSKSHAYSSVHQYILHKPCSHAPELFATPNSTIITAAHDYKAIRVCTRPS